MSDVYVDVDRFRQDGVLVVPGLLDEAEIVALRAQAEWVASGQAEHVASARLQVEPRVACGEERADNYADSLRKIIHIAFCDEIFAVHARNKKILDVVEALLGPDLKLYQDQLFMKPPRVVSRQPYHQDAPLGFHIDSPDMVTCWVALDDAPIDNGCMWMLPGTHRFGYIDRTEWWGYEEQVLAGDLPTERPIELNMGDCSFHHGLILHCSRPNRSVQRRHGYAAHYVSARCHYTGNPEHNDALLVRGHSHEGCL